MDGEVVPRDPSIASIDKGKRTYRRAQSKTRSASAEASVPGDATDTRHCPPTTRLLVFVRQSRDVSGNRFSLLGPKHSTRHARTSDGLSARRHRAPPTPTAPGRNEGSTNEQRIESPCWITAGWIIYTSEAFQKDRKRGSLKYPGAAFYTRSCFYCGETKLWRTTHPDGIVTSLARPVRRDGPADDPNRGPRATPSSDPHAARAPARVVLSIPNVPV